MGSGSRHRHTDTRQTWVHQTDTGTPDRQTDNINMKTPDGHGDTRQTEGHRDTRQTRGHQTDRGTQDGHEDTQKTWTWKYSNAFIQTLGHSKYLDIQSIKFGHRDIETLPSMGNCHTDKKRPSKNFYEIFYRQETFSKDFFL